MCPRAGQYQGPNEYPYNIAVVDAGGGLVAHVRRDDARLGSVEQDLIVARAAVAGFAD